MQELPSSTAKNTDQLLIDDISRDDLVSTLGTSWRAVSDRVMGGVSCATLQSDQHASRRCLHLAGNVRLDNNGGFVQMALDLAPRGGCIDARAFTGMRLMVIGNGERYSVHLRTSDTTRPWQSYRAHFMAPAQWQELTLPFSEFVPHRTDIPLALERLRRVGLVGIGREFAADLRLARLKLYA